MDELKTDNEAYEQAFGKERRFLSEYEQGLWVGREEGWQVAISRERAKTKDRRQASEEEERLILEKFYQAAWAKGRTSARQELKAKIQRLEVENERLKDTMSEMIRYSKSQTNGRQMYNCSQQEDKQNE